MKKKGQIATDSKGQKKNQKKETKKLIEQLLQRDLQVAKGTQVKCSY